MKYWLLLALLIGNLAYFLHSQHRWFADREGADSPHTPAAVTALKPSSPRPDMATNANLCLKAGPFMNRTAAEHVQQRLRAATVDSTVHQSEKRTPVSFQVYIPPATGNSLPEKTLYRLRAHGIHGQLVTKGPLKDGIALARFSLRSRAEQSALEYRKRGYTVAVQPVTSLEDEYWVELGDDRRDLVSQSLWKSLLEPYGLTAPLRLPCHKKELTTASSPHPGAARQP